MPDAAANQTITGLSRDSVEQIRARHGSNKIIHKKRPAFLSLLLDLAGEPMILLLLAAAALYFISGMRQEAFFMAGAILFVAGISIYQNKRSGNALKKLNALTAPNSTVIRDGNEMKIHTDEIVLGDMVVVSEGERIPADGIIVLSNDFSVNESMLTGEAMVVSKAAEPTQNQVYRSTIATGGRAVFEATAVGNATRMGAIGQQMQELGKVKSPLEIQIAHFVKGMVIAGTGVFVLVWAIHYFRTGALLDSLLHALTLAMSILPEEIPVAFASFMALGAWRLMKLGVIVKETKTVETLGSATVICVDKTGTITENRMELAGAFALKGFQHDPSSPEVKQLIEMAVWASEPVPFDPMEIALHEAAGLDAMRAQYKMVHEYPLSGKPPMMTHVFESPGRKRIIAAKGAPEALVAITNLNEAERAMITEKAAQFSAKGLRVLAVAQSDWRETGFPEKQQYLPFQMLGLVAFYDPPKANIAQVLEGFYKAGIDVKIITGDNAITTKAIAQQIGLRSDSTSVNGDELLQWSDTQLQQEVKNRHLFTRMFPEAKLRIINALKRNNEVVAMTGDGINDGPALKAAHIGIAMGKKGTEVAKEAASLVLANDNLENMLEAVAMGRKIYMNLKKAIRYIISIHIPIILTVFIPLSLGWIYPNIFTPVHVIFFELIMGPTCSIVYENEPAEPNAMQRPPHKLSASFFNIKELSTSIVQGLMITLGILLVYQAGVRSNAGEGVTRAMVFTTLIAANVMLTLVNRSFYYSVFTTLRYKNKLMLPAIAVAVLLWGIVMFIPSFAGFFRFIQPSGGQLWLSVGTGAFSALWYEVVKIFKQKK
ncbi:MAG: cation-translocating P-type ATPase [Chitinophagaceae bacterium]